MQCLKGVRGFGFSAEWRGEVGYVSGVDGVCEQDGLEVVWLAQHPLRLDLKMDSELVAMKLSHPEAESLVLNVGLVSFGTS